MEFPGVRKSHQIVSIAKPKGKQASCLVVGFCMSIGEPSGEGHVPFSLLVFTSSPLFTSSFPRLSSIFTSERPDIALIR